MQPSFPSNRRTFLKCSLAAGASVGFALADSRSVISARQPDPDAISSLAKRLAGRVILPTHAEYDAARRVNYWNPRTDRKPALIVRCAASDDVVRGLEFAHRHELRVAVRSGGHSYLGWGTSEGGLLLDLSPMDSIRIDPSKRRATVQGGVLTGALVTAAGAHGLVPVSGEHPAVGVAGLTLGGGLGWLSGTRGAACDSVHSAILITATGRRLRADATEHSDLFWGIRGGGGNFGVVTSFDLGLHQVGPVVGGEFSYPIGHAPALLRLYSEFMADVPDVVQADLTLVGRDAVNVSVCVTGDVAAAERALEPWRKVVTPRRDTTARVAYADLFRLPAPASAQSRPPAFSTIGGAYVERLSEEVCWIILDRLANAPPAAAMLVGHYMHGAVCRVAPNATAFSLRAAHAVHVNVRARWSDVSDGDACSQWVDETARQLRRYSGGRLYANFQSVEGREAAASVFAGNHRRLWELKRKYDPQNVFRQNPNVDPRAA